MYNVPRQRPWESINRARYGGVLIDTAFLAFLGLISLSAFILLGTSARPDVWWSCVKIYYLILLKAYGDLLISNKMSDNKAPTNYSDMHFALRNGINMPAVGLGTYRLTNHDLLYKTIDYALDAGYRLFDTAAAHNNERHLRSIFRRLLPQHGLTREDIFITTKLTPFSHGGKFVPSEFEKSLDELGIEYVDMYLIHFPGSPFLEKQSKKHAKLRKESWLALAKLYDESKVNAIGVSNFSVRHLMQLSDVMAVGPMVNQIEWHPYYFKPEMLQYCCDHNIRVQAYNSFGGLSRGNLDLIEDPVVKTVARKHHATSAQVLLLWALQKGVAVIPNSTKPYHINNNRTLNFRLSGTDIAKLDKLGVKNQKYSWDPTWIA